MAICGHGKCCEDEKESGGGGAGAAGRLEGRSRADKEHDTGATQGGGTKRGIGALVKKIQKNLKPS